MDEPKWWVDSSYAVHPDMKSHTGIYMTLGKGATCTGSRKQKLNTKSSTGYPHTYHYYIPRQHEYNPICREWKIFKLKENSTHIRTVLLPDRSNKKTSKDFILSYGEHARGFLYKTTTSKPSQEHEKDHN